MRGSIYSRRHQHVVAPRLTDFLQGAQLVVEAMRVGLELPQVVEAIESQWAKLERSKEVK